MDNIFERSIWFGLNVERLAFTAEVTGTIFFETDTSDAFWWDGAAWQPFGGGGGGPTEGPGIDIVGVQVGIGGDTILLYDSTGNPCAEYAASDAGLTAALAAMGAGDVIELPDVVISGGPWTVANGTVRGHSRWGTILDGEITVGTDCTLERLSVIRDESDAGGIYGVILEENARVEGCYINLNNDAGDASGVFSAVGSENDCYSNDNIILVVASGDGYAFESGGANIWASGGYVVASTAPVKV